MSWVDWCGKMLKDRNVFLSVLGYKLTTQGLLVQEHNYSATIHTIGSSNVIAICTVYIPPSASDHYPHSMINYLNVSSPRMTIW